MGNCQCCCRKEITMCANESNSPLFVNLLTEFSEITNKSIIKAINEYNWRKLTYNKNVKQNAMNYANKIFNNSIYKNDQAIYMTKWKKNRDKTKISQYLQPNIMDDVLFEIFSNHIKY